MFRPQEQTRPSAYTFTREGITFRVVLFRLHNSTAGAPRFQAVITWQRPNETDTGARVYNFRGSYSNEEEEAREILDFMISNWQ